MSIKKLIDKKTKKLSLLEKEYLRKAFEREYDMMRSGGSSRKNSELYAYENIYVKDKKSLLNHMKSSKNNKFKKEKILKLHRPYKTLKAIEDDGHDLIVDREEKNFYILAKKSGFTDDQIVRYIKGTAPPEFRSEIKPAFVKGQIRKFTHSSARNTRRQRKSSRLGEVY